MLTVIFTLIWCIALFVFLFYSLISLLFRVISYPRDFYRFAGNQRPAKIDSSLHYFVIVPCFNEAGVIQRTLVKLLQFESFEVVVVDDDSSDDSVAQIKMINNPRLHLLRRHLPNAHTGKGDVLNFALDYIYQKIIPRGIPFDKTIIGVVDADAQLAENALQRLNAYFSSPQTSITQMRVKMYPRFKNELQILQDIEFFSINHMAQIMRMYTRTVGLSGNGQFFRLQPVLNKIGLHPWGNALLDDYELTIKMMLKHLHVDYMTDTYVYQEALTSPRRFIRQRSRWVQGDLNCLKYLPRIIKSKVLSRTQKLGIYYFLVQPWLNLLADLAIIILTAVTLINWQYLYKGMPLLMLMIVVIGLVVFSLFWGIVFGLFYHHDLKHFNEPRLRLCQSLILPVGISYMYIILFFSIIIAFWRWCFHENSWIKTEHGKKVS
ncbi:glycosyltransferase family 2 protein [Limosilactobacillus sp. STM2_1]|uniref:Glycosyltransferase family 2 protein n=1 Tax=Limosilactobacillus rudii TaxID=2759755 RepID=A0A7W3UNR2_9LACO|nr:glycosyltransferase family 2 protein [Limosilactobacillus rudii]MBB1080414.1 glycosyltransferase family 2 protein [Limosilactobacillus rudii]MBB1098440.1 glycosyltransferase family 2 protein [Limosilactobacillus rudii]MCD7135448.1 glycosyltransferase [Limosilactobacillus rudii]